MSSADDRATAIASRWDSPFVTLGLLLLRWRRILLVGGAVGAIAGGLYAFVERRMYESTLTFIPQGSEGGGAASGLEMAASQFGIRVPSGGAFGPPVYVELMRSRAILEPLSRDTVTIDEEGGRREEIRKLLGVDPERSDAVLVAMRRMILPAEVKALGGVKVVVVSRWPSVSFAVAQRVVVGINDFNLRTRRSQASAERVFVESQEVEAEKVLRNAEDALQAFMERNRAFASPELSFERDRLQRAIALAQSSYNSLVLRKVESRIREVRDTPLITVLEAPRLPQLGRSRRIVRRAILGSLAAVTVLTLTALLALTLEDAKRADDPLSIEFFAKLRELTPNWLGRMLS